MRCVCGIMQGIMSLEAPHLLVKRSEAHYNWSQFHKNKSHSYYQHTDLDIGCDEVSTCLLPLILYRCRQAVMRVRPPARSEA